MANYFRATGYLPDKNVSFIADSNGKFEKLWQFSSYLVKRGCKIVSISSNDKFLDDNLRKVPENADQFIVRACSMGTETRTSETIDGVTYAALCVGNLTYIPDKEKQV